MVVLVIVVGSYLTLSAGKYSVDTWVDLLVDGASLGGVYALIALGYTMVYGILRMINFAHGDVFMIGAFAGYFTATFLNNIGFLNASPIASIISIALMMLVAATRGRRRGRAHRAHRLPTAARLRRAWCCSSRPSAPRSSCSTRVRGHRRSRRLRLSVPTILSEPVDAAHRRVRCA